MRTLVNVARLALSEGSMPPRLDFLSLEPQLLDNVPIRHRLRLVHCGAKTASRKHGIPVMSPFKAEAGWRRIEFRRQLPHGRNHGQGIFALLVNASVRQPALQGGNLILGDTERRPVGNQRRPISTGVEQGFCMLLERATTCDAQHAA
jgi:hypothetical protein